MVLSEGHPWAQYRSRYFDTPNLQLFCDHLRGRRPRYKVRVRHHLDRNQSFVEVKSKNAGERTRKFQHSRLSAEAPISRTEREFIARLLPESLLDLQPSLETSFRRATLLSSMHQERITIDLALTFSQSSRRMSENQLCLVELKQQSCSHATLASRILRQLHIHERSLSKYCTGIAYLHPGAPDRYRDRYLKRLNRVS